MRKAIAVGIVRYGEPSTVPTESKEFTKAEVEASCGSGLAGAVEEVVVEGRGVKPQEVGRVERISAWLRFGMWRRAQLRDV